jgi:tetratricopeptide (TPR) repeat protein
MLARVTQAEQLAAQAAQWRAAGRADMAAQLYAAALDLEPAKFALRMQLAECLVAMGQPEAAAEHYLMVAQAHAARGHHQECLAICDRVLAVAPHAFVYMTVGPMVRRIGRAARPVCARAAEVHLAAGRQTDGLQILRLGAELDPHNPDVRRQLARIYQARHMKREAVEALLDAGSLLLQARRYDDYVAVAEQILALEPRELDTLRDLPRVYLELRRPHDAVRMLAVLTKASPGDIVGYEILAQAFALIGRVDKSLSVLERLVEELAATGRADKADAILNHARFWRPTDLGFLRSLKRMEIPRPAAAPERAAKARPAGAEGTVVLSIADLLVEEGSKRAPIPGSGDVSLTEAEGTLTLRLDDLILDEMQQAAGKGVAPTRPPSGARPPPAPSRPMPPSPRQRLEAPPPPPPPPPEPVEATMALDASDLIEALTGDRSRATPKPAPHARPDPTLPLPPSPSPGRAPLPPVDDDSATIPPPGGGAAPSRSMSELIYDDDDDASTPRGRFAPQRARDDDDGDDSETLLHMRPLTAADIARALERQAQARQAAAPPVPAPPAPAPSPSPLAWAPPSSVPDRDEPELDAPTLPPPSRPAGTEEAPTIAKLSPLAAADIARALSQRTPTRPPVSEDAVTRPPGARALQDAEPPSPPPMLPLGGSMEATAHDDDDDDDDAHSTIAMTALRPSDLLRGPGGGSRGR